MLSHIFWADLEDIEDRLCFNSSVLLDGVDRIVNDFSSVVTDCAAAATRPCELESLRAALD